MSARKRSSWISSAEWRWFWTIALALAALSAGITALSTWLGKPTEPKNVLPSQSPFRKDLLDTIPHRLLLSDFDLPAPGGQWLSRPWLYSRQAGVPWTWKELEPYWTPPGELTEATLPDRNDRQMDEWLRAKP